MLFLYFESPLEEVLVLVVVAELSVSFAQISQRLRHLKVLPPEMLFLYLEGSLEEVVLLLVVVAQLSVGVCPSCSTFSRHNQVILSKVLFVDLQRSARAFPLWHSSPSMPPSNSHK